MNRIHWTPAGGRPWRRRAGLALLEFMLACPVLLFLFAVYLSFGKGFVVRWQCRASARYVAAAQAAITEKRPDMGSATDPVAVASTLQGRQFLFAAPIAPSFQKLDGKPQPGQAANARPGGYGLDALFNAASQLVSSMSGVVGSLSSLVEVEPAGQAVNFRGRVYNVSLTSFGPNLTKFPAKTLDRSFYMKAGCSTVNEMGPGGIQRFLPVVSQIPSICIPAVGCLP